jgi:hypothetical protein
VGAVSSALLVLETQDFAAACRRLELWVAEPAAAAVTSLARVLDGCAGMAGGDPGGRDWAREYDAGAAAAMTATAAALQAVDQLALMFAQTARNYAAADAASAPDDRRLIEAAAAALPSLDPPPCIVAPPSAAGGGGGGPFGWGLIADVVGYVWPDGHQDRLRAAAAAWRASAAALENAGGETLSAASLAISDRLPEAPDMWTVCRSLAGRFDELADVHRALADACDGLAHHLDEVHSAVEGELANLAEWTAGIQAVGGLLSVVTFGAAEAPTQAVEGARIAATAARVGVLIERFLEMARAVAVSIGTVADRALEVSSRLRVFLDARLTEAAVRAVGRYRMLRLSGDTGAIGRLGDEAGGSVRTFATRDEARAGLPGPLRAASNRFFRKATAKNTNFVITRLEDGGYRMERFSPANNAGYGKLYVRVIDSRGEILEDYKDTLGPNGLIERKWLHGVS